MLVTLHIICAFLSLALLISRGAMQLSGKDWRVIKPLKILPHVSDTLLIVTGIILLYLWQFNIPFWLYAKFIALVLYIIFSAKFFSKKVQKSQPIYFILACLSFVCAILLGYFH